MILWLSRWKCIMLLWKDYLVLHFSSKIGLHSLNHLSLNSVTCERQMFAFWWEITLSCFLPSNPAHLGKSYHPTFFFIIILSSKSYILLPNKYFSNCLPDTFCTSGTQSLSPGGKMYGLNLKYDSFILDILFPWKWDSLGKVDPTLFKKLAIQIKSIMYKSWHRFWPRACLQLLCWQPSLFWTPCLKHYRTLCNNYIWPIIIIIHHLVGIVSTVVLPY